jgi:phospholipid/cholesterol/gamma-HCH transport system substrate-binding protein
MEKIVGVFIVLAVLFAFAMLVMIARGKSFFVKKQSFYTYYDSGTGITQGLKILFRGMEIGTVTRVRLSHDNRIQVDFFVLKEYADRVKTDSVAKIVRPLIGSSFIRITAGSVNAAPLPDHSYIISSDTEVGRELLKKNKIETEGIDKIVETIDDITLTVKAIAEDSAGPITDTVEQLRLLTQSLNALAANLNSITGNLDGNEDRINDIILSFQKTADNLAEVTKNLKHNRLIGGKPEKTSKTVTGTK